MTRGEWLQSLRAGDPVTVYARPQLDLQGHADQVPVFEAEPGRVSEVGDVEIWVEVDRPSGRPVVLKFWRSSGDPKGAQRCEFGPAS